MSDAEGLMDKARGELARVYGFAGFRPGQEEIVAAVLAGEDVLAVMPTGSGKSLCFQLPALARHGLTLVVSPLIALMRDQVAQLAELGVAAAALNSASDPSERQRVAQRLRERTLRLLYIAPERLTREDTLEMLKEAGIDLLAIDEAHCVSQWGHDFRPEYLRLREAGQALGGVQTIAVTATADAPTRADIVERLFLRRPRVFVRSFDRPNLFLAMRPKGNATRQLARAAGSASRRKRHRLLRLAQAHRRAGARIFRRRASRAALSCRPRPRRALAQPGRLPARRRRRHLRDDRLRHGHRQARRALRLPRRHAFLDRGLLPGDRPRRPRRAARRRVHPLWRGRHRIAPPPDRRERRAR